MTDCPYPDCHVEADHTHRTVECAACASTQSGVCAWHIQGASNGTVLCDECVGGERMEDLITVRCWNKDFGIGLLCRECVARHTESVAVPRDVLKLATEYVSITSVSQGYIREQSLLLRKLKELLDD